MTTHVPMCPDCLVLMVERDGGWFCPYALAARAAKRRAGLTNIEGDGSDRQRETP